MPGNITTRGVKALAESSYSFSLGEVARVREAMVPKYAQVAVRR